MFTDIVLDENLTVQDTQLAMGTVMAYRIYGAHAQACLSALSEEIARLEELFSRFNPHSEVSRINQAAGPGQRGGQLYDHADAAAGTGTLHGMPGVFRPDH